jgi:hypothetical protein
MYDAMTPLEPREKRGVEGQTTAAESGKPPARRRGSLTTCGAKEDGKHGGQEKAPAAPGLRDRAASLAARANGNQGLTVPGACSGAREKSRQGHRRCTAAGLGGGLALGALIAASFPKPKKNCLVRLRRITDGPEGGVQPGRRAGEAG